MKYSCNAEVITARYMMHGYCLPSHPSRGQEFGVIYGECVCVYVHVFMCVCIQVPQTTEARYPGATVKGIWLLCGCWELEPERNSDALKSSRWLLSPESPLLSPLLAFLVKMFALVGFFFVINFLRFSSVCVLYWLSSRPPSGNSPRGRRLLLQSRTEE